MFDPNRMVTPGNHFHGLIDTLGYRTPFLTTLESDTSTSQAWATGRCNTEDKERTCMTNLSEPSFANRARCFNGSPSSVTRRSYLHSSRSLLYGQSEDSITCASSNVKPNAGRMNMSMWYRPITPSHTRPLSSHSMFNAADGNTVSARIICQIISRKVRTVITSIGFMASSLSKVEQRLSKSPDLEVTA